MIEIGWLIAAKVKGGNWLDVLDAACKKYNINNPYRIAAFLAQTSHESAGYTRLVENLNYSAEGLLKTFPKYFSSMPEAKEWERKPMMIGNRVYGGRMGNIEPGDGYKFRGRGLIHITGRDNYESMANELSIDCVNKPELLEQPQHAAMTAALFWHRAGCNALADNHMFKSITQRVNGGVNGLAERTAIWNDVKKVMHL